MAVLLRLAAAPQQVVPRETLLAEVWPRRMVNDDVLSRAIADLRTALSDDAREARFIETIPKVGYRLIAPVAAVAPPRSCRRRTRPPARADRTGRGGSPRATPSAARRRAPAPDAAVGRCRGHRASRSPWQSDGWRLQPAPAPALDRATLERQLAQAEPLASDKALEVGPRFSPDGRQVAYAEGSGSLTRIVVRTLATGERRLLGDAAHLNLAPVFFPDGARVAYFRRDAQGECAIVAEDLRGGAPQDARRLHAQAAARSSISRRTAGISSTSR